MANVVRRYQRTRSVVDLELSRMLGAAFVSAAAPLPGEFSDVTVDNAVANYATDTDAILSGLGFAFVAEAPAAPLDLAAAAAVPPVQQIREGGGVALTMGAVANGQVLTRSGTQIIGTAGGAANPRDVFVFDHFLSSNFDTDEMGSMGWRAYATGTGSGIAFTGVAGAPGVLALNGGTAAAARSGIACGEASLGGKVLMAGTNPLNLEFRFRFPAAGDFSSVFLESMMMGFGLNWQPDAEETDGLFIRYAPLAPILDTNYKLVAVSGGTSTVLASTTAPAAGTWVTFVITYTPGTGQATWSIDGVPVAGNISTNIPAIGLGVGMKIRCTGGGAPGTVGQWDYVLGTQAA